MPNNLPRWHFLEVTFGIVIIGNNRHATNSTSSLGLCRTLANWFGLRFLAIIASSLLFVRGQMAVISRHFWQLSCQSSWSRLKPVQAVTVSAVKRKQKILQLKFENISFVWISNFEELEKNYRSHLKWTKEQPRPWFLFQRLNHDSIHKKIVTSKR